MKKDTNVVLLKNLVITDERKIKAGATGKIVVALKRTALVEFDCGTRANARLADLSAV